MSNLVNNFFTYITPRQCLPYFVWQFGYLDWHLGLYFYPEQFFKYITQQTFSKCFPRSQVRSSVHAPTLCTESALISHIFVKFISLAISTLLVRRLTLVHCGRGLDRVIIIWRYLRAAHPAHLSQYLESSQIQSFWGSLWK